MEWINIANVGCLGVLTVVVDGDVTRCLMIVFTYFWNSDMKRCSKSNIERELERKKKKNKI